MNKIAFFDFCETLVNFQTADEFVRFTYKKVYNRELEINKFYAKILFFLDGITRYRFSLNKRAVLRKLKGLTYHQIDTCAKIYYDEVIKPNFIQKLIDVLNKKKVEGYNIVIVSGGYNVYLKYFAKEFYVTDVISTRIGFRNEICTGKFDGIDCLNFNKVSLLDKIYNSIELYSEAYSDSITDIPFLKWANEGYVVSRNYQQSWNNKYKFKEIVWEEKRN